MSQRIRVLRKVLNPPIIDGFKPYGQESVMMGVSMPTCTRIYASALQNVAKAFIKGSQITIKGGKVNFDRYNKCAGGDCSRVLQNKERALKMHKDKEIYIIKEILLMLLMQPTWNEV